MSGIISEEEKRAREAKSATPSKAQLAFAKFKEDVPAIVDRLVGSALHQYRAAKPGEKVTSAVTFIYSYYEGVIWSPDVQGLVLEAMQAREPKAASISFMPDVEDFGPIEITVIFEPAL